MRDLRTFIGAFFAIIGALLALAPSAHAPLTDAPVNLYTGLTMLGFGAVMVWMGLRAGSRN